MNDRKPGPNCLTGAADKPPQSRRDAPKGTLALPTSVEDYLLYASIRRVRAQNRGAAECAVETALRVEWPTEVRNRLTAWLRTGTAADLGALLAWNPASLGHPLVFRQLWHLRQVSRTEDAGDSWQQVVEEGEDRAITDEQLKHRRRLFDLPEDAFPAFAPAGTREAAVAALRQAVEGWVSGMLPGWTLHAPRRPRPQRRRGRRPTLRERESAHLLLEHNELRKAVRRLPKRSLRCRDGERPEQVMKRAVALVEGLHRSHWRSMKLVDRAGVWEEMTPVPRDVAQAIAAQAVGRGAISSNRLVYGLLGHYWGQRPEQIRGRIERAEAANST